MKNFVLIGLILYIIVACSKKNETTTIEGKVLNIGSKQPIDSVQVFLRSGSPYSSSFLGGSTAGNGQYVSTYTDKYGYFKISMVGEELNLYLSKQGYRFVVFSVDGGSSDNFKSYNSGQHYVNEILELWADAYFKGEFKGQNSVMTDSIYFDEGKFVESLNVLRSRNHWNFGNGPFSPYNEGWIGIGDEYFAYWMRYQIHGVWHQKVDSVFIKSFTTYTDTIYY